MREGKRCQEPFRSEKRAVGFRPGQARQKVLDFSPTRFSKRLVKTGGRLVKHSLYYWLLLAESRLTRRLFSATLRRIELLPRPGG